MNLGCDSLRARLFFAFCLMLAIPVLPAQKAPDANSADAVRAGLAEKAHALEARGRPDLAAQLWQQMLLSAPENTDALSGLAREYKLMGSVDKCEQTLDRLRRVSPSDPDIARIEAMPSTSTASEQLRQAGELAREGNNDGAMRIYRELYGEQPPDGDIALAYYETLFGAASGRQAAVAGMRTLAQRNPGDARYPIALGRMLTYDARTRDEGMRLLREHAADPAAQAALRQALIWNAANPASAADLRDYLKTHPQDAEIAQALKNNEAALQQMNSGIARTPEERAAFAALNARHLDEAERRFSALLDQEPGNGRAAAGMGFLRMQQKNFASAISFLTQAGQDGFKEKIVDTALATSRFFFTMGEAAQAFAQNQLDVAADKYRAALDMSPRSADALNGLAGAYIQGGQYAAAADVEQRLIRFEPASIEGWRGLFLAFARANEPDKALAVAARFPARIKAALNKDPEFLGALASIYESQGRSADAQRVLAEALALPFPGNGATLLSGTRLSYAGILMQARHYPQAAALFAQVLAADPDNVSAWEGLISADHELDQDSAAIAAVESMPPAAYETALDDSAFLAELGAIYQWAHQYEVAQGLLERAQQLDAASGRLPSVTLQLQLAGIDLLRNNTGKAYGLYRQVLAAHPENPGAWKGLISALAGTQRNDQALAELAQIPNAMLKQLDNDIEFLQTEAGVYAVTHSTARAMQLMDRVQAYYAKARQLAPPSVDVENCWLLYNVGNDRALYSALMRMGGRNDLAPAQRETVEEIWADWSVRRAAAAMDNGDSARAIDILDAAALAFPDNLTVHKAVAGGYARVGRAREALALFKTTPMQDASAGDFEGAVGAALAANDRTQAELWLRQALDRFGTDPGILTLAARYEQARGDNERAADYYRASLAAMPPLSAAGRLAHVLVSPEQDTRPHRAVTAADLEHLLDPDDEPFAKTVKPPPIPAYGPDPASGGPPVVLTPSQPTPQTAPAGGAAPDAEGLPQVPVPHAALERPSAPPSAVILSEVAHQRDAIEGPTSDFSSGRLVLASLAFTRPVVRAEPPALRFGSVTAAALQSAAESDSPVEITLNPPHSLASDTWKGLILLLIAGHRNAEALAGLAKIPSDVRRQLEADLEWVQEIAGLYQAVGDTADAALYCKRVENFYRAHGVTAPAGLAAQTGDRTNGSAARIHNLPNAPVAPLPAATAPAAGEDSSSRDAWLRDAPDRVAYSLAQDTPHASQAATGSDSAPGPTAPATPPPEVAPTPAGTIITRHAKPSALRLTRSHARKKNKAEPTEPTLGNAPIGVPQTPAATVSPAQEQQPAPSSEQNPQQATTGTGLSDQELEQRNLPPLRGPWVRVERQASPPSPRDEAEAELHAIESGFSGWLGGTTVLNYRSGDPGFSQMAAVESPFESSAPLGANGRITAVARPVFLDSGQANGNATLTVTESTISGSSLVTIPEPIGTLTGTNTTLPAQQNAAGLGGELQLAFPHFAIAGGYTPSNFLVSTFTGRMQVRPGNGPITISLVRDSEKDSELSYAGLRDPGQASLSYPGQIWGGVVYDQGEVEIARGDAESGFYFSAGGQVLTGYNVESNRRIDGTGGAYWRAFSTPEYGTLSIGANFFAMHYANNQNAFTHGMGGYFSPQGYFLANVPFSWTGHYLTHLHYSVRGAVGAQGFQEDATPLWPLDGDKPLQISQNNPMLPNVTSVSANYDLRSEIAYQIGPHWFAGGTLAANNSRDYSFASIGFFVRFLFREQPSTATSPTGLFPWDGLRPFTVP